MLYHPPPSSFAYLTEDEVFLRSLRREMSQLENPAEIMRCCARQLAEHIHSDRCAYATVENEEVFVISGDYCRGVQSIVGRWPVAAFGTECVRQMLANEPYVVTDVETDPRAVSCLDAYRATQIRSVICVPLHKDGKFTAAMAVHQATARTWTETNVELVRAVVANCWESLERVRGSQRFEEASTRLELALWAAELGDWSWDMASDIVTMSQRAAEIFGIPESPPMTWADMREMLQVEDREGTTKSIGTAVEDRRFYDVEYRVNRPDGSQVWVSSKGKAVYAKDGTPFRMYGVVQDISRQKGLEERLRAHGAELAEADRKKDRFIALLAHELRNPLAPLRAGMEVLRMGGRDAAIFDQVSNLMDRQLSHIVRLIDDLLDVSRITQGKLMLKIASVGLSEIVNSALEFAAPGIRESKLQVTVDLPQPDPTLNADATRLIQVLSNLIGNSVKFTPEGGVIAIRAAKTDCQVEVSVSDTGIGIAADKLPHIFDMFVQVQPVGSSIGGLGIGLALSKTLVELHHGSIAVESEGLGKGVTMTVTLPL